MFAAARMYDLGEGLPLDQGRAIALYKDAALKGHADAQNALATYFYNGQLLKQDLATARKLFQALEAEQDKARQLDIEYGQLQIEMSTWATHPRLEKIARERLRMVMPAPVVAKGGR